MRGSSPEIGDKSPKKNADDYEPCSDLTINLHWTLENGNEMSMSSEEELGLESTVCVGKKKKRMKKKIYRTNLENWIDGEEGHKEQHGTNKWNCIPEYLLLPDTTLHVTWSSLGGTRWRTPKNDALEFSHQTLEKSHIGSNMWSKTGKSAHGSLVVVQGNRNRNRNRKKNLTLESRLDLFQNTFSSLSHTLSVRRQVDCWVLRHPTSVETCQPCLLFAHRFLRTTPIEAFLVFYAKRSLGDREYKSFLGGEYPNRDASESCCCSGDGGGGVANGRESFIFYMIWVNCLMTNELWAFHSSHIHYNIVQAGMFNPGCLNYCWIVVVGVLLPVAVENKIQQGMVARGVASVIPLLSGCSQRAPRTEKRPKVQVSKASWNSAHPNINVHPRRSAFLLFFAIREPLCRFYPRGSDTNNSTAEYGLSASEKGNLLQSSYCVWLVCQKWNFFFKIRRQYRRNVSGLLTLLVRWRWRS